jgi:hypothetical protein
MRLVVLTGITLLMSCMAYQCSRHSNENDGTTNPSDNVSTPSGSSALSEGLNTRKGSQSRYDAVLSALRAESAKLGIVSLIDSPPGSGTEVRVLIGFGLLYPRCFILNNRSRKNEATFIAAQAKGNNTVIKDKGRLLTTSVKLDAPVSGWDDFDKFLNDHGIGAPIKLSLDSHQTSDPDEELLVIEIKLGSEYSMVFFSPQTQTEDGKKAWQVCDGIEREFGVSMGCAKAN